MNTITKYFLTFFVLLLAVEESLALGRVYARIPNYPNSPIYNLRIKSLKANVVIQDQLAVTSVDQEFANDNSYRLEGFYVFQLPEGAQVNEMYLWINGVRVAYTIKKRSEAVVIYQEIVTKLSDPAILEQLGSNLFKLRIFPFDAHNTRRIEIQYSQPLTYYKGSIQYTFPLDMKDYDSSPIETVALSADIRSQLPITDLITSVDQFPAAVKVTRIDQFHYTVVYGVERVAFAKDFFIRSSLDRGTKSMLALTYRPPDSLKEAPYFIYWAALPDTLYSDSVQSRELTFVADVSSSMEGARLQQLKDALGSFVDLLTEHDRFNIVAFSTTTVQFRPDLVAGTPENKDAARTFVSQLVALGLTNFEAALHQSLQQTFTDPLHSAVVFLTDGQPSWGETDPDSLLAFVRRWNTQEIRLFPVGVGDEPDYSFLERLAQQNSGTFTRIAADDSIYLKVKDLYRLLFLPAVKNIQVDFGQLGALDVHPIPIPNTFVGDQLLLTGRFATPGIVPVKLTGSIGSRVVSIQDNVQFVDTAKANLSVSRFWGAQKIQSLLNMIAVLGEQKELVDQVIALSIRYAVLTPYTAFLVVEPGFGGTDVAETPGQIAGFGLLQNYPNPFNPSTTITFTIPGTERGAPTPVSLVIYDMLGRQVRILVAELRHAGTYTVMWDGRDDRGIAVASGTYICRLVAAGRTSIRSMVLVR